MRAVAPAGERPQVTEPRVPRAVVGPTASGKTAAGALLAARLDGEVVACDSMTVYRGMDVGTAKPDDEERALAPHHLLDVADPDEPFSVARYQELARGAIGRIRDQGRIPILVGGTGLYFRAVVDELELPGTDAALRRAIELGGRAIGPRALHARLAGIDPDAAEKIDPENLRRTVRALEVAALTGRPFSTFAGAWDRYPSDRVVAAGVRLEPETLRRRIEARVRGQYDGGLVEEVRGLLERGSGAFLTASQAIGYLEVVGYLEGRLTLDEAAEVTTRRTKALARRQMAWFRRDPRIRWFDAGEDGAAGIIDELEGYLAGGRG